MVTHPRFGVRFGEAPSGFQHSLPTPTAPPSSPNAPGTRLVRSRWTYSSIDWRAYNGAQTDTFDHTLVRVRLHLRITADRFSNRPAKLEREKLKTCCARKFVVRGWRLSGNWITRAQGRSHLGKTHRHRRAWVSGERIALTEHARLRRIQRAPNHEEDMGRQTGRPDDGVNNFKRPPRAPSHNPLLHLPPVPLRSTKLPAGAKSHRMRTYTKEMHWKKRKARNETGKRLAVLRMTC